ncbi:MAG: phosphinothricin acetyltransferase [Pseudohongiellaceae bacterium]|jgi:phosphinothricin acetyltransferase
MISANSGLSIRVALAEDAKQIVKIYDWCIEHTTATFKKLAGSREEILRRIKSPESDSSWLVAHEDGKVLAYAYATQWKSRPAYHQSVETNVYVKHSAFGQGLDESLMRVLIDDLADKPIHVLIVGITLPNLASIAPHGKLGFSNIGKFNEVGYKFGKYINVGYCQLILGSK